MFTLPKKLDHWCCVFAFSFVLHLTMDQPLKSLNPLTSPHLPILSHTTSSPNLPLLTHPHSLNYVPLSLPHPPPLHPPRIPGYPIPPSLKPPLLPSHPTNPIPGDTPLLTAARHQARASFAANASLLAEDPALAPAIAHALEVARILRENVVQGRKTEGQDDKYSEFILFSFLIL